MVAQEAQIAGAIPVCTTAGALPTTVGRFGRFIETDSDAVREMKEIFTAGPSLDLERQEMALEARERFDVRTLADEWLEMFE